MSGNLSLYNHNGRTKVQHLSLMVRSSMFASFSSISFGDGAIGMNESSRWCLCFGSRERDEIAEGCGVCYTL